MRTARALLLLLLLAARAPAPTGSGADPAEFARGAAAVGERPTDAIALRSVPAPSPAFRMGAAYRAWRNAGAAIDHDASHPTGDGGDAEVLAEDCSDERLAFTALDAERAGLNLTPAQVIATMAPADRDAAAAWQARQRARPAHCGA